MKGPHKDLTKTFTRMSARSGMILFAAIVLILTSVSFYIRNRLQEQLLHRDAFILQKVAQAYHENNETGDLFDIALDSSELSGVLAVRIFDSQGRLLETFPFNVTDTELSTLDQNRLMEEGSVTEFFPEFRLSLLFEDASVINESAVEISRVLIPITQHGENLATIEYWVDAAELAEEFNKIDQTLLSLTPVAIFLSGLLLWVTLYFSNRSIYELVGLVQKRNEALEEANAHLALSAKTSAIGTLTTHLFHELKNPIAGLRATLINLENNQDHAAEARVLTQRIQTKVNDILRLIKVEGKAYAPELTIQEMFEHLQNQFEADKSMLTWSLENHLDDKTTLPGNRVSILTLVLATLIRNSIDAAQQQKRIPTLVTLIVKRENEKFNIQLSDTSGGIPEAFTDHLFQPKKSGKETGSGIGLALCAELIRKMEGTLELVSNNSTGATFKISFFP